MRSLTYRDAGVSVAAGDRLVERIKPLARSTRRPEVLGGVGGFAAAVRVPRGYAKPLIVSATDGVGTKLRLAFESKRHDTVGIDLVAMNVNDIITLGAEPLAFLDYFATGKLSPRVAESVIRGIAEGCRQAGCALVGGETAEMPSFYAPGEYDLAGFVIGVVDEDKLIDGRDIRPGDVLIGLGSSGLHSNGFSLVRKLVFEKAGLRLGSRPRGLGGRLGDVLLTPTRIYARSVAAVTRRVAVKGMVHVTGGGVSGNLPRILPRGCQAAVDLDAWPVPPVFGFLQGLGRVRRDEMFRTFNMGIGFVLVVEEGIHRAVLRSLKRLGERAFVIGSIEKGKPRVRFTGSGA